LVPPRATRCHARESGHLEKSLTSSWIPACERVKELALSLGL
jgi:hypothetical protein